MPLASYAEYHDEEAEQLFLGCLLLDPAAIRLFVDKISKEDFDFRFGLIWEAMCDLTMSKVMPDVHEVKSYLQSHACGSRSSLAAVGGEEQLRQLTDGVAEAGVTSTAKVSLFAERVERATDRRLMQRISAELMEASGQPDFKPHETYNWMLEEVVRRRRGREEGAAQRLGLYGQQLQDKLESWWHGRVVDCTPTGLWTLDRQLGGGLAHRRLCILAGAPGSFKTTLVEQWSQNQAECGFVVGMSSVEMAGEDLLLRMATRQAGIDLSKLTSGEFNVDDVAQGGLARTKRARLLQELAKLGDLPIYVDDRPVVSTSMIYFVALTLSLQHGLDVWYIDFADLVQEDAEDAGENVKAVFRRSKEIARLLGIPVVVVSQVRKEVESRDDKKPRVDDVLYRGHDVADTVLLTWDPWGYYETGDLTSSNLSRYRGQEGSPLVRLDQGLFYIVIGKNRYGPKGTLVMNMNRDARRISDPSDYGPRKYMGEPQSAAESGF